MSFFSLVTYIKYLQELPGSSVSLIIIWFGACFFSILLFPDIFLCTVINKLVWFFFNGVPLNLKKKLWRDAESREVVNH